MSQSDEAGDLEALNKFAYVHFVSKALEKKFAISRYGVERKLSTDTFPVRYEILLPDPNDEPLGIIGSDRIIRLNLSVVCDRIEYIVHKMVSPEIIPGHNTFYTGLDLLSKVKSSSRQLHKRLLFSDCLDHVVRVFDDLLTNCEPSLMFLTRPGNLLKSVKNPIRVYSSPPLFLRELALLVYMGRSDEVDDSIAFAQKCRPDYLRELNLTPEEIDKIRDRILKGDLVVAD